MSQNQRKAKQQAAAAEPVVLEVVWQPTTDAVRVRGPKPVLDNRLLCYGILERAKDAIRGDETAQPAQRRLIEIPEMVFRRKG